METASIDQVALRRAFAEYADVLLQGDYHVGDVLYGLSDQCVDILGVAGAGVSLSEDSDLLQFVTATDGRASRVEAAQLDLGDGPCYHAFRTGQVVAVGDLEVDDRWPDYRDVVLRAGYRSVLGVALPSTTGETVGALNLYDTEPREWGGEVREVATLLSNMASGYILMAQSIADARTRAQHLQRALDSRVVIEQAKGVLSATRDVDVNQAFELLRAEARSSRRRIHDLARDIVEGRDVSPDGEVRSS